MFLPRSPRPPGYTRDCVRPCRPVGCVQEATVADLQKQLGSAQSLLAEAGLGDAGDKLAKVKHRAARDAKRIRELEEQVRVPSPSCVCVCVCLFHLPCVPRVPSWCQNCDG